MRLSQIVNIPIQNIYYLLYYPCGKLAEKDVVAMEAIDWTPLLEMTVATTSGVVRRPPPEADASCPGCLFW